MQTTTQKESYIVRHGLAIIAIAMTISAVLGMIALITTMDAGMTLSPVMLNEECLPINIGFSLQFMCP